MSKEKELKQHLQQYDKDTLIELYLQKDFDTKQQLADSFSQEDVEGLIKDRDITIKNLKEYLAEKDKEIEQLKKDNNWYSMWHKKFQKEIEDLKTELETYRPTHLKGNGQCQCSSCKQTVWTDWCIKYDGKIYCNKCFKQVETRDDKLRHQICEKIRESAFLYAFKQDEPQGYFVGTEILDQIEKESAKSKKYLQMILSELPYGETNYIVEFSDKEIGLGKIQHCIKDGDTGYFEIETDGYGYIYASDYDDNFNCKPDPRFNIISIRVLKENE